MPSSGVSIGESQREFSDPDRSNWRATGARGLRATIWYPATTADVAAEPPAARDAPTVRLGAPLANAPERLPLVLLSHGSGNHADQLRWLGIALAGQGFIVVAPDHNGSQDDELGGMLTATDFFAWERARDVSVVLDHILADASLGPRIDPERIGAAGFSLGGTTVLWLGGARLDLELLRRDSPPPPPFLQDSINALIEYSKTSDVGRASIARAGQSYRDPRIRAIFALSPAMGPGFPEEVLRTIDVPVGVAVGDADVIAPAKDNAARFAHAIPRARLIVLPGERGHYTQPIEPAKRGAELGEVSRLAANFFREILR